MTIINTGLTEAGLRSEFQDSFEGASQTVLWPQLTTTLQSNKDEEKYAWMGATPPLREWGTGRVARPLYSESYSVKNLKYEATIEVDRDEISDDQTGSIRLRTRELAARAAGHKDKLLADLISNGHSTGFHSYDAKPFFATDHSSGVSGNQSNNITTPAVSASAPTVAEIRTGIKAALKALMSILDDQGEPANVATTGLVVVTPPETYIDFSEALMAQQIGATTNVLQNAARVVAFSRITAASAFYVFKVDQGIKPFILQSREELEFKALAEGSSEEFLREKYYYGVRARYRMTYGLWQHALKVTFTE